jgi:hypothetical protein
MVKTKTVIYNLLFFNRTRREALSIVILFIAIIALPIIRLVAPVSAISDTTPMQIVSLELAVGTVDVSVDDGYAEIIGEIYEDLSGFQSIYFYYTSPSGGQIVEGDLNGDPQYINASIRFPFRSEPGIWKPTLTLSDVAGNTSVYTPSDLLGLGFNAEVTVVSANADTEAPTLDGLTFDATTLDTGSDMGYLSGNAVINDNLSTIQLNLSYLLFTSPSGTQRAYGYVNEGSGNTFMITNPFLQYTEVGTWTLEMVVADSVGNTRLYDNDELASLSFPNTIEITGTTDLTPVSINALNFSAAFPPLEGGDPTATKVTLHTEFTDNLSGIAATDINFYSQTTTQVASGAYSEQGNARQFTVTLPAFAATGVWLPQIITYDLAGNMQVLNHADLLNLGYNLEFNFLSSDTETVGAGGSITTDPENDGATPAEPFEAALTSPFAGDVSISQVELTNPVSSNDYLVFDQQYDIEAPEATPENPIELRFRVDASSLEDQTAQTLVVFRNGSIVQNCIVPGVTDPDPCVTERNTLGDGDVELVVLTSHASIWVLGYPTQSGESYTFNNFKNPIKSAPYLNESEEGSTIPVKFDLGGDQGLDVLPTHIATSQKVNCTTKEPIGDATPVNLTNNGGLSISDENIYKFQWKTLKKWENSCRQLILEFNSGETIVAYFKFDD